MMALLQRHLALLFRQHYHLLVVLVLVAAVVVYFGQVYKAVLGKKSKCLYYRDTRVQFSNNL